MDCGESESVNGKTFIVDVHVKTAEIVVCIIKEWNYYSKNCWVAYGTLQDDGYTHMSQPLNSIRNVTYHTNTVLSKQLKDMSWPH